MTARLHSKGLSYVEVLVAIVLVMTALVPALQALQPGVRATDVNRTQVRQHFHLNGKLEEVLAVPFNVLDDEAETVADPTAATAFSDPAGAPDRRLVMLTRYDGDNADGDGDPLTGVDVGLLRVEVRFEDGGEMVQTLTTRND